MITYKRVNSNIKGVLVLALLLILSTASASTVTFELFDNGASTGGVEITMEEEEFPVADTPKEIMEMFALLMSHHIEVRKFGQEPGTVVATKAFREDGERITSFKQLNPAPLDNKKKTNDDDDEDGEEEETQLRRVYLVADGLEFVWPFIHAGHLQTVSPRVLSPVHENKPIVLESMSDSPRVFKVLDFFNHDESEFLINHASKHLARSTVGNADEKGKGRSDKGRTSENAWDSTTYVAKRMITRSFNLTGVEEDVGKIDGLQVVRYLPGQFYNEHPDYFSSGSDKYWDFNPYSGGSNRFATVFMYINDVEEGGCTVFPRVASPDPTEPHQYELDMFKKYSMEYRMVQKCHSKLAVPPKQGTAALFYSITPDGQIDPMSHHGACPVIKGTKWGANIWIWNRQRFGNLKTGEARSLQIVNTLNETVYLTWEGKSDGEIAPGATRQEGTFEFHRFKAHLKSHKDPTFVEYTVQTNPKHPVWKIERPRLLSLDKSSVQKRVKRRQQVLLDTPKVSRGGLRGANGPEIEEDPEHSEDL